MNVLNNEKKEQFKETQNEKEEIEILVTDQKEEIETNTKKPRIYFIKMIQIGLRKHLIVCEMQKYNYTNNEINDLFDRKDEIFEEIERKQQEKEEKEMEKMKKYKKEMEEIEAKKRAEEEAKKRKEFENIIEDETIINIKKEIEKCWIMHFKLSQPTNESRFVSYCKRKGVKKAKKLLCRQVMKKMN
eukprot:344274_1